MSIEPLVAHSAPAKHKPAPKIWFERHEFDVIMTLYGRGQMAGAWRDYAIDDDTQCVVFSIFRRASESPMYRIEKRPSLAQRQGQWTIYGAAGQVLKRGHALHLTLDVLERTLLKIVASPLR